MSIETKIPSLFELHPELNISPEELKKRNARGRAHRWKWLEESDTEEQADTHDFLMKALADARESNRESKE